MTCKDCVHYEVCLDWATDLFGADTQFPYEAKEGEKLCDHFKPKSRFVELPCEVGQTVYVIDLFDYEPCKKKGKCGDVCPNLYAEYGVGYECKKSEYGEKPFCCAGIKTEVIEDISQIFSHWTWFGKTVFLSKEEAENALKEKGVSDGLY